MKLPCRLTLWQTNRYVALFLHHLQQIQQYHPPKSTGKSQEIYIITTIFHRGLWNRKKIWLWIVKNRGYGKQFQSAMHQKTLSNRNSSSNVHVNSIGASASSTEPSMVVSVLRKMVSTSQAEKNLNMLSRTSLKGNVTGKCRSERTHSLDATSNLLSSRASIPHHHHHHQGESDLVDASCRVVYLMKVVICNGKLHKFANWICFPEINLIAVVIDARIMWNHNHQ